MSSIIQEKITSGTLTFWHSYEAGHIADLSATGANGTFNGSPVFQRDGLKLDGANDYISGTGTGIYNNANVTICIQFTPDFDTDKNTYLTFIDSTSGSRYAINKQNNANGNTLRIFLGNTQIAAIAEATYSPYWNVGEKNTLIASGTTGNTDAWLNGNQILTNDNTAWSAANPANIYIGARYDGALNFDGTIHNVLCFTEILTTTENQQLTAELNTLQWSKKPTGISKISVLSDLTDTTLTGSWNMRPVNNTVADLSGNGNDGTLTGTSHENSLLGDSLKFNGSSDYIDCGTGFQSLTDVTVSFWVKFDDLSGTGDILTYYASGTDSWGIGNSTTNIRIIDDIDNAGASLYATAVTTGVWYHVVGVMDSLENKLYIDGTLVGSGTSSSDNWSSFAGTLKLGWRATTLYLNGKLVNPAVYSEAKDQAWVTAEYEKGARAAQFKTDFVATASPATEGGTVGQFLSNTPWQFGESAGRYKISTDTIDGEVCKVIECTTAGWLYLSTDYLRADTSGAAYGTSDFWLYKGADANTTIFMPFATEKQSISGAAQDGYYFAILNNEQAGLRRVDNGATTNLSFSSVGYISLSTWINFKITRSTSGAFTWYIDGSTGDSSGTGSNPVTDTTHTTSSYSILELDAGDKFAYSDKHGAHNYIKHLGVI